MKTRFVKFFALATVAQLTCCVVIWISVLTTDHALDFLFEKMVFFYWPIIVLVGKVIGTEGESAMIAVPVFGVAIGILVYGFIIAGLISYVRRVIN